MSTMRTYAVALFAGVACARYIHHGGFLVHNNCEKDVEARSAGTQHVVETVASGKTLWRSFPPVDQPFNEEYVIPGEEDRDIGALYLNRREQKFNFAAHGNDYHLGFVDDAGYLDGCIDISCPEYEISNGTGVVPVMSCEYGLHEKCIGERFPVIQTVTLTMVLCPSEHDKQVAEKLTQIEEEQIRELKPVLSYLTELAEGEDWDEPKQRQLLSAIALAATKQDLQLLDTLLEFKDAMDVLDGEIMDERLLELMYSLTEQYERKIMASSGKDISVSDTRSVHLAPRQIMALMPLISTIIGGITFFAVIAGLYESSLMAARTS